MNALPAAAADPVRSGPPVLASIFGPPDIDPSRVDALGVFRMNQDSEVVGALSAPPIAAVPVQDVGAGGTQFPTVSSVNSAVQSVEIAIAAAGQRVDVPGVGRRDGKLNALYLIGGRNSRIQLRPACAKIGRFPDAGGSGIEVAHISGGSVQGVRVGRMAFDIPYHFIADSGPGIAAVF